MYLFKYILKRLGLMLMTFLIIITICFVLVKLLPNVPAETFGKDAALIAKRRELLGYNKPIMVQYVLFWKYALQGNFGISEQLYIGQEVWGVFVKKLLDVYERCEGKKGECIAIGGGTYVHSVEGGVAFGVERENTDYHMHGANEWISTDELLKDAVIFTEAIIAVCGE